MTCYNRPWRWSDVNSVGHPVLSASVSVNLLCPEVEEGEESKVNVIFGLKTLLLEIARVQVWLMW